MKKLLKWFFVLVMCFLLKGYNVKMVVAHGKNVYKINARFENKSKKIYGTEEVSYTNDSGEELSKIVFRVFLNAFKSTAGYIKINLIKINNKTVSYSLSGKDNSVLSLKLNDNLPNGNNVKIELEFESALPNLADRCGYGSNSVNLCQWYPIIAPYASKTGWYESPYDGKGDPFFSENSDYSVEFTTEKKQVVASTGSVDKTVENGLNKTLYITANDVRDFALILSPKFKIKTLNEDGIKIKSYYFLSNGSGEKAAEFAQKSIRCYNKLYGKYPYKEYSVVASDMPGGMEYPMLVMIDDSAYSVEDLSRSSLGYLENLVAHETAHQWWYGVVGNNEYDDSWLDESPTEYSTFIYYENVYGKSYAKSTYDEMVYDYKSNSTPNKNLLRNLGNFNDSDYFHIIYERGPIVLNNIRNTIGDANFFNAMKDYYNNFKFKIATTKDLIDEFVKVSNKDYYTQISNFINGKSEIKYSFK